MARGLFNPLEIFEPENDFEVPTAESSTHLYLPFYFGLGYTLNYFSDDHNNHSENSFFLQGGYHLNYFMALETRFTQSFNNAKASYSLGRNMTNVALYLKPSILLTNELSLYGLFGYGRTTIERVNNTKSESHYQWGTGLSYKVKDKIDIFCDYTSFYVGNGFDRLSNKDDLLLNAMNVGVTYNY